MISCIIIDDNAEAIKVLAHYIEKTPFLHQLASFTEPVAALSFIQQSSVDLIFSDIEMPDLSGIELLKIVGHRSRIILSTGYSEYALQGYELDVVDYLMKPVSFERFLKAVQKVFKPYPTVNQQKAVGEEDFILIKTETKGKLRKVATGDIHCIEGLKNYVTIYTKDERIVAPLNIKDLKEKLASTKFLRVHRSYVVATDRISAIEGNQLVLKGTTSFQGTIPLGATYREAFFHAFRDHILERR